MDIAYRQIIPKAAGVYFVVTDLSQVTTIVSESKMRLIFINSDTGPINMLFYFAKGDKTGFTNMFGKPNKLKAKKGNFSIDTCLDALNGGPIAVINLRAFDDNIDKTDIVGMSPNTEIDEKVVVPYTTLFNINNFWLLEQENISYRLSGDNILSFSNSGTNDKSIFVVKSVNVNNVTANGNKTLANCGLVIDELPALDMNMLLSDTVVDVWLFDNTFGVNSNTNAYYGHLFDNVGNIDLANLTKLSLIPEAGFKKIYTGSVIPNLVNENSDKISIDDVVNSDYTLSGLVSDINIDLFELPKPHFIDMYMLTFFDIDTGDLLDPAANYMLSHKAPDTLSRSMRVYPPKSSTDNVVPTNANLMLHMYVSGGDDRSFESSFQQGVRVGDKYLGADGISISYVTQIELLNETEPIVGSTETYTKIKCICDKPLYIYTDSVDLTYKVVYGLKSPSEIGLIKPFNITSYKPRLEQFTDGTAIRQKEILDMMINPGIINGIIGQGGIRYIIDSFKSFVESSYKYQYGSLCESLNANDIFCSAIINEPFVTDLQKSTDPIFRDSQTSMFKWEYVPKGGNPNFSRIFLTKYEYGANYSMFYGPGNIINNVIYGISGLVSNLFYNKQYAFDVVANETGYIDGIIQLEVAISQEDRKHCEDFSFNPIIKRTTGYTIFGNNTGQKINSAQKQCQNMELLLYIKESLLNMSTGEAFKKATSSSYLATETEVRSFMNGLVRANAIEPNPIVICNLSNNPKEIQAQRLKVCSIEYSPLNSLEKIIFDIKIK